MSMSSRASFSEKAMNYFKRNSTFQVSPPIFNKNLKAHMLQTHQESNLNESMMGNNSVFNANKRN